MRERVKNSMSPGQAVVTYQNNGCNTGDDGSVTVNLPLATIGEFKHFRDEITARYSERRRKGEVIINPLRFEELITASGITKLGFNSTCASGPDYHVEISGPYVMHLLGGPPRARDLFTSSEVDSLIAIASTKCWADVNVAETQSLVSLLEFKKTFSLLIKPLSNVLTFLAKAKKAKDLDKANDTLTMAMYIAKEWLTYRYGWCNLYRDVTGTLKALAKDEREGLTTARGSVSRTREVVDIQTHTPNAPSSYEVYTTRTFISHEVNVRCGIFYDSVLDIKRYLGLSKYNILETAWEVIPYSFVFDWVVNVQNYLNALLPFADVPVKGSYTTVDSKYIVHREVSALDVSPRSIPPTQIWTVSTYPSGVDTTLERRYNRSKGVQPPSLTVDFKIKDLFDVRVRDALALIINRLDHP